MFAIAIHLMCAMVLWLSEEFETVHNNLYMSI